MGEGKFQRLRANGFKYLDKKRPALFDSCLNSFFQSTGWREFSG